MFYILTREDCIWCDKAKELLATKGEGFRAFSYQEHPLLIKLMITSNMKTVPQVWCENEHIGGYKDLEEWFDSNKENY